MKNSIKIEIDHITLQGILIVPNHAKSIVIFAHGSGSSRFSPRNQYVSKILNDAGIATLLVDLMTEKEDSNIKNRFDIDFLAQRLKKVITWISKESATRPLSKGIFGASTGAACALQIASILQDDIKAVVSRGGRPDMALDYLSSVRCPTMFIVGEYDHEVTKLNEMAYQNLACSKKFIIIKGATHLFEEKGCLEQVANHAKEWFLKHLEI
jgi:putative phosphoribosyl transferase